MNSFNYISRDSKDYSSKYDNNINNNGINIGIKMDTRIVTINEYNPNKTYDISIYKFVDILNTIEASKNAIDICNNLHCNNTDIKQKALDYGLTYKNIFNGDNNSFNARKVLEIIKCEIKPKINIKTFKTICYVKWKIYEISNKYKQINNHYYNDNDNISEWIGVLAGLILYFDELDEINYNTSRYVKDVCKPLTVNDI